MKLPPAATYASRTSKELSVPAVQPNTLPPRHSGKTCSPVLPRTRRETFVVAMWGTLAPKHRTQRPGHLLHLPLRELGEERECEGARGDVLAHGELPRPVAEAL